MQNAMMNCFVDTNLLIYAIDPREKERRLYVADLLRQLVKSRSLVVSPQSLSEFYRAAVERHRLMPGEDARSLIEALVPSCTAPYNPSVIARAWEMQDKTNYGWWDCMLLAAADIAGCRFFLSEDLQHRHTVRGLTILNPFKSSLEFLE